MKKLFERVHSYNVNVCELTNLLGTNVAMFIHRTTRTVISNTYFNAMRTN